MCRNGFGNLQSSKDVVRLRIRRLLVVLSLQTAIFGFYFRIYSQLISQSPVTTTVPSPSVVLRFRVLLRRNFLLLRQLLICLLLNLCQAFLLPLFLLRSLIWIIHTSFRLCLHHEPTNRLTRLAKRLLLVFRRKAGLYLIVRR